MHWGKRAETPRTCNSHITQTKTFTPMGKFRVSSTLELCLGEARHDEENHVDTGTKHKLYNAETCVTKIKLHWPKQLWLQIEDNQFLDHS